MYYRHCWAFSEIYWHFDWHPEQKWKEYSVHISGGLAWCSTQVQILGVQAREPEGRRGPLPLGWSQKSDPGAGGSYPKLGGQQWSFPKPWTDGRTLGQLQHSQEKFPKTQDILKKTSFNPVVLTQTLSLMANVLPHGYLFAHYGFSHVITVLLFSLNTIYLFAWKTIFANN